MRLGPRTAPTVVAQTTYARSRATCSGLARSLAAYLACKPTADATPTPKVPSSTTATQPTIAPTTTTPAPDAAIQRPVARPIRRPLRVESQASGPAANAAPI